MNLLSYIHNTETPFFKYVLRAWGIAIVPAAALSVFSSGLIEAFGLEPNWLSSLPTTVTPVWAFIAIVFAPLIETAAMIGLLRVLQKLSSNNLFVATASALLWGSLHARQAVGSFLPSTWSFFIFSSVFLAWYPRSKRTAFWAPAVAHVGINSAAIGLIVIFNLIGWE
jgi:membrane protease YdiL (CAAX protease family)